MGSIWELGESDHYIGAPSVQSNNLPSLRKLLNTFTEKLEALKNAGVNEVFFFLTNIILRKLDPESRKGWEQYSAEEKRWRDLRRTAGIQDPHAAKMAPHGPFDAEFELLTNFLVSRVQTWERATGGVSNVSKTTQSARSANISSPALEAVNQDSPDSFTAGPSVNVPRRSAPPPSNQKGTFDTCPRCRSKDHTNLQRCPSFLQFGEAARHEALKRLNVCFNCLSSTPIQGLQIEMCVQALQEETSLVASSGLTNFGRSGPRAVGRRASIVMHGRRCARSGICWPYIRQPDAQRPADTWWTSLSVYRPDPGAQQER